MGGDLQRTMYAVSVVIHDNVMNLTLTRHHTPDTSTTHTHTHTHTHSICDYVRARKLSSLNLRINPTLGKI